MSKKAENCEIGPLAYPPEAAARRRQLVARLDALRAEGYGIEIDIMVLDAQELPDGVYPVRASNGQIVPMPVCEYRASLVLRRENAYASARALQVAIDALPAPTGSPTAPRDRALSRAAQAAADAAP